MAKKDTIVERVGQVWIRKRPDRSPFWYVRWLEGVTRNDRSLKVTNKEVARKKAQEISDLLERGQVGQLEQRRQGERLTFNELVDQFESSYTNWSETTRAGARTILKNVRLEWGYLPLTSVTSGRIEQYLARMGTTRSPSTINRYLATLKTLFKCATRWGYLADEPTALIKMQREQQHIPEAFTREQLEAILNALPSFAQRIGTVAADTGMRRSEIQRLVWNDIDLDQATIIVRDSKNRKPRIIPMTRRVRALIGRMWDESTQDSSETLLPFDSIKKSMITAGKNLGIGHIHFHQFRHTYITLLLEAGVPINQVQYLAGHKTIAMTMRYDHPSLQRHRAATEALEYFLTAGPTGE